MTTILRTRAATGNSPRGIADSRPDRLQLGYVDFPQALRERRSSRRLSQLDLAIKAGTTQRHLSFIESGRSAPGREMVIRLTESLGLPLRERNELLLKAGYAPAYPETPLDGAALAPVREALQHILTAHEPYPAIVVDRHGDIVAANAAQQVLFDGCAERLRGNAFRLALHPDGMAPRIRNFAEWARHVVNNVAAELARNPDDRLAALHAELTGYVPPARLAPGHLGFAVPLRLGTAHGELNLMTTITTFATAVDVTISELKLEAFLPADPETAAALNRAHGHSTGTMAGRDGETTARSDK
jgi:transcriptional regulator with XRE-family HTH domain